LDDRRLNHHLGIEIPSSDPLFLSVVVGIHIPLGLACIIFGAITMLSEKRRGRHSKIGKVYYWCLLARSHRRRSWL